VTARGGGSIEVRVNGESRVLPPGCSVEALLRELGIGSPARVAVEFNREILPKSRYAETELSDGDRIEVVQFVGGG
jgi:thiamine biosynthesis protein ThiS